MPIEIFFHRSRQFLNSSFLTPFKCFCRFLFHLFHISKTFLFEDFFHPGKQKKVTWGEIGWIGRLGHGGHTVFGQKLNIQCGVGRCTCKSPIMKWANALKESSKKQSLKPSAASHNNASWCTDTDGFLEHSPSRGSLYSKGSALEKVILCFFQEAAS